MTQKERFIKRGFDMVVAAAGLLLLWPVIAAGWVAASLETRSNGFFLQERIGMGGKRFKVINSYQLRSIEERKAPIVFLIILSLMLGRMLLKIEFAEILAGSFLAGGLSLTIVYLLFFRGIKAQP